MSSRTQHGPLTVAENYGKPVTRGTPAYGGATRYMLNAEGASAPPQPKLAEIGYIGSHTQGGKLFNSTPAR